MGFQLSYFKSWWCCERAALNMPPNLENSTVATGLEKVCFHSSPKERQCQECSNYHTIAHISHANKVMFKILKKATQFQKNIYFYFIDYAKAFDCVDHKNCRKFLKRWEYQTTWPASWEICMQVTKQVRTWHGTMDCFKTGKGVHLCCIFMHHVKWVHHVKCWAGWITSWNQDCQEKYQPQICRWHHPYGRKWRGTQKPLDESESEEWKSWPKAQHSENEDHGIWSHYFMANRRGNSGSSDKNYYY